MLQGGLLGFIPLSILFGAFTFFNVLKITQVGSLRVGGGSAQQDQSPALSCCVSYDLYDLRSELPIVCLARLLVSPGSCRPMALPGSRRVIVAREAPQMHGPQLWMACDGAGAQGGRRQQATPWRLGGVARRVLCVKNARPLIPSTTACSPCHMSWCGLRPDTLWQRWDGVLGWLGGWWVTGGFVGGVEGGCCRPFELPWNPWYLVPGAWYPWNAPVRSSVLFLLVHLLTLPAVQVFLVLWGLGHLIEGAAGFGTGPAMLPRGCQAATACLCHTAGAHASLMWGGRPWAVCLLDPCVGIAPLCRLLAAIMAALGHPPFESIVCLLIMTTTVGPFGS